MAMDPAGLGDEMHAALEEDGDTPAEVKGMAAAIVAHIVSAGIVTLLPGTVTGTCPPGGPLAAGAASNGVIAGLAGPVLAADMAIKMGKGSPTPQLIGFASGVATHLLTGLVSFTPGGITGTCTNSPTSPGPFIGQGNGGKISGLDGDGMATLIAAGLGSGPASAKLKAQCGAIVKHIMQNAEVTYITGTVIGTAPPGGGPLVAGSANGGKIT